MIIDLKLERRGKRGLTNSAIREMGKNGETKDISAKEIPLILDIFDRSELHL